MWMWNENIYAKCNEKRLDGLRGEPLRYIKYHRNKDASTHKGMERWR